MHHNVKENHIMDNMNVKIVGKLLTVSVDLSKQSGDSSTGKSVMIASTGGNVPIEGGLRMGLNVYRPIPRDKWSPETIARDEAERAARKR